MRAPESSSPRAVAPRMWLFAAVELVLVSGRCAAILSSSSVTIFSTSEALARRRARRTRRSRRRPGSPER